MAGDAVSITAKGRLMMIETTKPSITVLSVAAVSASTVGVIAIVSSQIRLGAGTRNSGTLNSRQMISHTRKVASVTSIGTITSWTAAEGFLRGFSGRGAV